MVQGGDRRTSFLSGTVSVMVSLHVLKFIGEIAVVVITTAAVQNNAPHAIIPMRAFTPGAVSA